MEHSVVVKLEKITKRFGPVTANENVDLLLNKGEIHALLGENGAGKSTLMNMLSGIYSPDSGSIFVHSEKVHFTSPKHAISYGIKKILLQEAIRAFLLKEIKNWMRLKHFVRNIIYP